jgi:hypothetical protein
VTYRTTKTNKLTISRPNRTLTIATAPNAAVQRPRAALSSAARVHNEVTHMRRARDAVSRSAATACYTAIASPL